jgi:hypothetical protein
MSVDRKFGGKLVFIPQITLEPSAENMAIVLKQQQFVFQLAFTMIINKSQGQLVQHVGLDLWTTVFSCRQLYVALSQCISQDGCTQYCYHQGMKWRKHPRLYMRKYWVG